MVHWRSIRQEGKDDLWKEQCRNMEEESMEKCRVEDAKKDARTRDEVSRKMVIIKKKRRSINFESGQKIVGPEFFHGSENTVCSGTKGMHAATKDGRHGKDDEELGGKRQNGRTKTLGGSVVVQLVA